MNKIEAIGIRNETTVECNCYKTPVHLFEISTQNSITMKTQTNLLVQTIVEVEVNTFLSIQ